MEERRREKGKERENLGKETRRRREKEGEEGRVATKQKKKNPYLRPKVCFDVRETPEGRSLQPPDPAPFLPPLTEGISTFISHTFTGRRKRRRRVTFVFLTSKFTPSNDDTKKRREEEGVVSQRGRKRRGNDTKGRGEMEKEGWNGSEKIKKGQD